jgi:hypothetical protein
LQRTFSILTRSVRVRACFQKDFHFVRKFTVDGNVQRRALEPALLVDRRESVF